MMQIYIWYRGQTKIYFFFIKGVKEKLSKEKTIFISVW